MKKTILCLSWILFLSPLLFAQFSNTPSEQKMDMAMYAIKNLYVDEIDANKLVEDGLRAMVKELDPHSAYMTIDEVKEMNEPLQGGFDGIGISFNMLKDTLFVIEVISGGPSEKVGLLPGDRIINVDGKPISGVKMSNTDVMKRLKGPKGTTVKVSIKRRGLESLKDFSIIRDKIPIYSLDAAFMVDKNTGYIRLNRFGATTVDEFNQAFADLKKQGMTQLVLDLQSNGGGFLNAATDLADQFLSEGKCIVYTQGLHNARQETDATAKGCFEKGKLVILIDEYSASASEILSGAIQDWDRGLIIGRRSFGKGLVQRPIPLPDGSMLKLTVSRYFTPSGRFIQKPYENAENYSKDLIDRYNRGEMSNSDSIHFPDSLRTSTLVNKRTIYGGGGIMPDVFVPMDTTLFTNLHKTLAASGIMNRYSIQYVDEHRSELNTKYPTMDKFIQEFSVNDSMINQMIRLAESEKITIKEKDLNSDKTLIKKLLVPNDTTLFTNLNKTLTPSGIINRYSNQYIDEHRAKLNAINPTKNKFIQKFSVDDSIRNQMIRLAVSEKITIKEADRNSNQSLLKKQLKAFMARDLGKSADYYKVMWTENESLMEALRILNEKKTYDELLKRK
ncbi:MAG TPA: S41 family peptidase [Bacteroidales bacterium]